MGIICFWNMYSIMSSWYIMIQLFAVMTDGFLASFTEKQQPAIMFRTTLLHIEVSPQSSYSIYWELCWLTAGGTWDDAWVVLRCWNFTKAKGTQCVEAWQELGLVSVIIIVLITNTASWNDCVFHLHWWTSVGRCHFQSAGCNKKNG